jgi:hypothetical protein
MACGENGMKTHASFSALFPPPPFARAQAKPGSYRLLMDAKFQTQAEKRKLMIKPGHNGNTALHTAAFFCKLDIVKYLVSVTAVSRPTRTAPLVQRSTVRH